MPRPQINTASINNTLGNIKFNPVSQSSALSSNKGERVINRKLTASASYVDDSMPFITLAGLKHCAACDGVNPAMICCSSCDKHFCIMTKDYVGCFLVEVLEKIEDKFQCQGCAGREYKFRDAHTSNSIKEKMKVFDRRAELCLILWGHPQSDKQRLYGKVMDANFCALNREAHMIWRTLGIDSETVEDIDQYFEATEGRQVNFIGVVQSHSHENTGLIAWHTQEDGDYIQNIEEIARFANIDYVLKQYHQNIGMRVLLLLTCGSTLGKTQSLKHIKEFMISYKVDYVFGFTAKYLIPHVVIHEVVNILGRFMTYEQNLETTFIENISMMSPAFEHSGLVILQLEANQGITSRQLQLATKFKPWGLSPPPCDICNSVLNVLAKKMKKDKVKIRCSKCKATAKLSREGLRGWNVGRDTRLWLYPWPYENPWKNVEWLVSEGQNEEMDMDNEEDMDLDE